MLRNAVSGDEVAIEEFLSKHACTSMFLRSNLSQFGLSGSDDPRATTFWLDENVGEIQGVFGASRKGFLMFQAPVATPQDWIDFATVLSGRSVQGMTGEGAQVAAALPAIGFEGREFALKSVESLYQLELEALKMPEANGDIRPAQEHDRELLAEWVLDYDVKTLGSPENEATQLQVREKIEDIITKGKTRILEVDDRPVAKTAFNAALPDIVQIGPVYTPPKYRNRGYARQVVAQHLKEARDEGVQTAVLFSSGAAACRAYEAIGFERVGTYTIALLANPITIGKVI